VRLPISPFGVLLVTLSGLGLSPVPAERSPGTPPQAAQADDDFPHEFYFTRAIYSGFNYGYGRGRGSWTIDYPKADNQFLVGVLRLMRIDAYPHDHAVALDDPQLYRFPFLYAVEIGRGMNLTDEEVAALRRYLFAGGFLVVDDFWGSLEWANAEFQLHRVLPEYQIVEIPLDHPLFHGMYDVKEIKQVPNVNNGCLGGPYWEQDGYEPHVLGIFDDQQRLLVVINWNTDLGDAWEWAEQPCYPLDRSTYAWEMGINYIVYGMSH
jgi:hypothetical protein